jgi:hypothetical protein
MSLKDRILKRNVEFMNESGLIIDEYGPMFLEGIINSLAFKDKDIRDKVSFEIHNFDVHDEEFLTVYFATQIKPGTEIQQLNGDNLLITPELSEVSKQIVHLDFPFKLIDENLTSEAITSFLKDSLLKHFSNSLNTANEQEFDISNLTEEQKSNFFVDKNGLRSLN